MVRLARSQAPRGAAQGESRAQAISGHAFVAGIRGRERAAIARPTSPFTIATDLPRLRVHWVEPQIVVQIGFMEWTPNSKLRHPRRIGIRGRQVTARRRSRAVTITDGGAWGNCHVFDVAISRAAPSLAPTVGAEESFPEANLRG